MTKKILSLAFVTLLFFSCKENNAESAVEAESTTPVIETVQPAAQTEQNIQNAADTETQAQVEVQQTPAAPANAGPFIQPQQNTQNTQTTGQTAPGFSGKPNPPHGQPGHRCDIQVGDILP